MKIKFTLLVSLAAVAAFQSAQSQTWNNTAGGSWNTSGNWTPSTVPNATGATATISTLDITAPTAITLDAAITVGSLSIGDTDNTHSYTVSNGTGGSLTFNNGASNATLTQVSTSRGDTISANMTLGTNLNVTNASANRFDLTGPIALGGNTLTIAAGNGNIAGGGTYMHGLSGTGSIVQNSGWLRLNSAAPATVSFTVNAGTLSIASASVPAGNISLGALGSLDYQSSGNATYSGVISGAGGIRKSFLNGTFTLSNNNTYTGTTIISAGTLLVNGDQSLATGNVTVQSTATLGGNGTIGGAITVENNGILAPGTAGDPTTTLTLNNRNLSLLGTDSKINLDIAGTAGGAFDRVVGIDTFAQSGDITFNLTGSYVDGDSWNVFGFSSKSGSFDTVTLAGSYSGSLLWDGANWTNTDIGGQSWKFDESTGTLAVIPEPSTFAMLGLAVMGLCFFRKRALPTGK